MLSTSCGKTNLLITHQTRHYLCNVVSQSMHSPSEEHMNVVYRIVRFLKNAQGEGLFFAKNRNLSVEGYIDADWAGAILD